VNQMATTTGTEEDNVYTRLGVRTLVNAYGTLTVLGGSRMAPEVTQAMAEAAGHFVDLNELLERAGARIAELVGVEAATMSSGAAAGLTLAAAACIASDNKDLIQRLPDCGGAPNRIAIHHSHRNGFDQALRQAGAELVEFGGPNETLPAQMEAALDDRTVAVAYFVTYEECSSLPLPQVIEIAHRHALPVIVDAAAELPPLGNLRTFCDQGADVVIFSGGKGLEGPQSSGLIVGRREWIRRCALNSNPNAGVGRPMKVGKEEIVGLLTAVERYMARDHAADWTRWEAQVGAIVDAVGALPGVTAERVVFHGPGVRPATIPRAVVRWDRQQIDLSLEKVVRALRAGDPAVAVGSVPADGALFCNPHTLGVGEEHIVARRLCEVLSSRRA